MNTWLRLFLLLTFLGLGHWPTWAQEPNYLQQPLPMIPAKPVEEGKDYESRHLKPMPRVHNVDPNIYAYTADFAKRFHLPQRWVTPDLQGAEAIAFRIEPTYRTCGWGGNPEACKNDESLCVLDVYFDHQKQPLPWDARMPTRDFDYFKTSAFFIGPSDQPLARPVGFFGSQRDPFSDSQTGTELRWQEWFGGLGYLGLRSYDKEIFKGKSLLTFQTSCGPIQEIWLATELIRKKDLPNNPNVRHWIGLPQSWQDRVNVLLQARKKDQGQFFKQVYEDLQKAGQLPGPQPKP